MSKTRFIGITVLCVLLVGITSGAVLAQNKQQPASSTFAGKVASILGMDETTVKSALSQAKSEMREERRTKVHSKLQGRLNEMVASGKLTQEQADQKTASVQSGEYKKSLKRKSGGTGKKGRMKSKRPVKLSKLVAAGKITQEQADQKLDLIDQKLNALVGAGKLTQEQADQKLKYYQ